MTIASLALVDAPLLRDLSIKYTVMNTTLDTPIHEWVTRLWGSPRRGASPVGKDELAGRASRCRGRFRARRPGGPARSTNRGEAEYVVSKSFWTRITESRGPGQVLARVALRARGAGTRGDRPPERIDAPRGSAGGAARLPRPDRVPVGLRSVAPDLWHLHSPTLRRTVLGKMGTVGMGRQNQIDSGSGSDG